MSEERPRYYSPDKFEVWDVADAWGLDKCAYLFNVLKYIARAGKKSKDTELQDLKKARNYLNRKINQIETSSRLYSYLKKADGNQQ